MESVKILCVDNNTDLLIYLKRSLKKYYNLDIDTVKTLFEAHRSQQRSNYDVIFLDVHLDGENGLDFLNCECVQNTKTKIILCTSSVFEETPKGAVEVLNKPFSTKDIINLIEKYYENNKKSIS